MAKPNIEVGSQIVIEKTKDGWRSHVVHAEGGISGKLAKEFNSLDAVVNDLKSTFAVD